MLLVTSVARGDSMYCWLLLIDRGDSMYCWLLLLPGVILLLLLPGVILCIVGYFCCQE